MKKLILFVAAMIVALPVSAAPPKEDKKDKKDKKEEKKKEVTPPMWTVQVEGGSGDTAAMEVKTILAGMKGVRVEESVLKDGVVEAVISSGSRVNRTDVSKALREGNKTLKLKEFKMKRPEKEGDKKAGGEAEAKGTEKKDPLKKEPAKSGLPAKEAEPTKAGVPSVEKVEKAVEKAVEAVKPAVPGVKVP